MLVIEFMCFVRVCNLISRIYKDETDYVYLHRPLRLADGVVSS